MNMKTLYLYFGRCEDLKYPLVVLDHSINADPQSYYKSDDQKHCSERQKSCDIDFFGYSSAHGIRRHTATANDGAKPYPFSKRKSVLLGHASAVI